MAFRNVQDSPTVHFFAERADREGLHRAAKLGFPIDVHPPCGTRPSYPSPNCKSLNA